VVNPEYGCLQPGGCAQVCSSKAGGQPEGGAPQWGQLSFDNFGAALVYAFVMFSAMYALVGS
jgi:hypothetical protein